MKFLNGLFIFFFFAGRGSDAVPQLVSFLIHSANPVVITIFTNVVRPSLTFQIRAKQNHFHVRTVIATGRTLALAEWIMDDTCLILSFFKN